MAGYADDTADPLEEVNFDKVGTRTAQAVSYPQLLDAVMRLNAQIEEVLLHLREVTGDKP